MKSIRFLALLTVFSLVLVACGGADSEGDTTTPAEGATTAPAPGDTGGETETTSASPQEGEQFDEATFVFGALGNETFDPILGPPNNDVFQAFIYDTLVGLDYAKEDLSKETGLASDWTISDDGLTYTFTLRPWTFHNGDEVTAEDVKFSLDRSVSADTGQVNQRVSGSIESVTVNSPTEVEVRLKEPVLEFLYLMTDHNGQIVPKEYFESVGSDGFEQAPIGSGPYKVVERQVGSHMTLEQAYPEHFGIGVPRFETITIRLVTEASTRLAMLRSGEADFVDIGIRDVEDLEAAGFQAFPSRGTEALEVLFQYFRPDEATADINVRKALSYAIDREAINEAFLDGLGILTATHIQNFGNPLLPPQEYDPDQARDFLAQTEYGPDGETLTMYLQVPIRVGWPDQLAIAQVIQSQWAEIGVESEIIHREYGSFRPEWAEKTLEPPAAILFTNVGFPTAAHWVQMAINQYHCEGTLTNQCDPEIDRLLEEWGGAETQEEAAALASELEQFVIDNYYMIVILQAPVYFAGSDKIRADYTPGVVIGGINSKALAWNPR